MPQRLPTLFDLETPAACAPGEGTRVDAEVRVDPLSLGGQRYAVAGGAVEARVDVSRTVSGFALRLRFDAPLDGPVHALHGRRRVTSVAVDAREVEQPGEAEELHSPYVEDGQLELAAWARDALVLALPARCSAARTAGASAPSAAPT